MDVMSASVVGNDGHVDSLLPLAFQLPEEDPEYAEPAKSYTTHLPQPMKQVDKNVE